MSIVRQAVRDYGRGQQPSQLASAKAPIEHDSSEIDGTYQAHIALVFAQGNFAQLEKIANQLRLKH